MHIMIYNKIVIFKNYITTCLWKTKRGTVITYREASKKIPKRCQQQNKIKKKKKKTTKTIALNSSEFPMKTLGLSLASISPGAMGGKWMDSEKRVKSLKTRPIHWECLMLSLSRQEGWRDKLRNSPGFPLNEVQKVTESLGEGRGGKPLWALCGYQASPWQRDRLEEKGFGSWLRLSWAPKPSFYP